MTKLYSQESGDTATPLTKYVAPIFVIQKDPMKLQALGPLTPQYLPPDSEHVAVCFSNDETMTLPLWSCAEPHPEASAKIIKRYFMSQSYQENTLYKRCVMGDT